MIFGFDERQYKANHILISDLRQHERELYRRLPLENVARELIGFEHSGESWSIFKDGKHIASGGAILHSENVAGLWQLPSKHVAEHQITYAKYFKWKVVQLLSQPVVTRLQTICVNDDLHNRWMTFLGFQREGVLRQFGTAGEDYALFARLKHGC